MNGDPVPRKHRATYLGAILTDNIDNQAEISNRLVDCINTCNRLGIFWKKAETTKHWKLRVFEAVLRSKLMYGLETIQLTDSELNRIDAFQIKNLRRIMGIKPTCVDRTYSNREVLQYTGL